MGPGLTGRWIHLKKTIIFKHKTYTLTPFVNHASFNYQYKTSKKLTKNPYSQSDFTVNVVSTKYCQSKSLFLVYSFYQIITFLRFEAKWLDKSFGCKIVTCIHSKQWTLIYLF